MPLPWTSGPRPFGFGPPGSAPWLPQPGDWGDSSVEAALAAPDSMLVLARTALRIRRHLWLGQPVNLTWLAAPDGCLAFRRGDAGPTCLVNFADTPQPWTSYGDEVVLRSACIDDGGSVPARSTVWLL